MAQNLNLVNAVAAKRLVAGLLDIVPVLLATMIYFSATSSTMSWASYLTTGELLAETATASMSLSVFVLAYAVVVWGWEAGTGKTLGNVALGLRTTDEDGFAPGWGKVFIRRALVWVAGILPVVGPVIMLLSNLWDPNHQRQGWHDKAARTLVVDVNQGRNPLLTGGLFGPSAFAPGGVTAPGQPGHPDYGSGQAVWPALAQDPAGGPITGVPGINQQGAGADPTTGEPAPTPTLPAPAAAPSTAPAAVPAGQPAAAQAAPEAPLPPAPHQEVAGVDEDEAEYTQLRSAAVAQTVRGARLRFDDGQVMVLDSTALVGRNPAAQDGEGVAELFNYADMGRSVSKTHLHLAADSSGVWVTDRNSTNGSGIAGADGVRKSLAAGKSQHAEYGETVYFGDRYFVVSPA
ncbi:RDD family protein [Arthrobacter sp. AOP36-C1-22]|uniref:RDD family protein n=1 Tax=Arthrobacter sp. AOP36-C1-22 TaxID=3457683 RepID=UPI004034DB45